MLEQLYNLGTKHHLAFALNELATDPLGSPDSLAPVGTSAGDRIASIGTMYCDGIPPFLTKTEG